jgi:gluconate 2-dehydrogenase gamma chain
MQRREVVRYLGAALALPFLPKNTDLAIKLGRDFHRRLEEGSFRTLNRDQQALVTEIAELIIPETDTPGATQMKVPEFIDLILTERADDKEKSAFLTGLSDIDAKASALGAARFVHLTPAQKTELLTQLDAAREGATGIEAAGSAGATFARLKMLTVYGYFTSEYVQEKILHRQMYFPRYEGNVPFTPAV